MSSASEAAGPRTAKVSGMAMLLAATALIALVAVGAIVAWILLGKEDTASTGPPSELAGFHLTETTVGPDAITETNRMHGTEIDLADAWVAHYGDEATIWASWAATPSEAGQLLLDMIAGIQEGDTPYHGLSPQEKGEITVYSVWDGERVHYFYRKVTLIVWVASPVGSEEVFLEKTLREVD